MPFPTDAPLLNPLFACTSLSFSCKFETLILLLLSFTTTSGIPALLLAKRKTMVHAQARFTSPSHFTALFGMMVLTLGMGSWPLSVYAHAAGNAGGKAANV